MCRLWSKAVTKSQMTVSHHSSVASVVEPAQSVSCLPCTRLERDGSRASRPARKPGRPVAALHINEPSLRQSQGDVIRGTVQGEARLRGTTAETGRSHFSGALHFLGSTAEFGGEPTGTGRGASGFFNCLKCFHCSKLSCHG